MTDQNINEYGPPLGPTTAKLVMEAAEQEARSQNLAVFIVVVDREAEAFYGA